MAKTTAAREDRAHIRSEDRGAPGAHVMLSAQPLGDSRVYGLSYIAPAAPKLRAMTAGAAKSLKLLTGTERYAASSQMHHVHATSSHGKGVGVGRSGR
jgi:hypothetical protein